MGARGTETRQLTEGVFVRFAPADLDAVKDAAKRRDVSVAQLLREISLRVLRVGASWRSPAPHNGTVRRGGYALSFDDTPLSTFCAWRSISPVRPCWEAPRSSA